MEATNSIKDFVHVSMSAWKISLLLLWVAIPNTAVSQQAPNPLFQVERYDFSASFRQDFCQRYRLVDEGGVELRNAVQGMALRSIFITEEYFLVDPTTQQIDEDYPGIMGELMDEFCLRAGCTWRDSFAVVDGPGVNRTFTDLGKWVVDTYDLSVDWWSRSKERIALGIAFTEPWYDASIVMITRKPGYTQKLDPWSWLKPFDITVWLALWFTVLASGGIYYLLEKMDHKADKRRLEKSPVDAIYLTLVSVTTEFLYNPRTHPARLFAFSVGFFGVVVSSSYTANLASFLVHANNPIRLISSMEDAFRQNVPICVFRGSYAHDWISTKYPYADLVKKNNHQEILLGVAGGDCAVGLTSVAAWEQLERDKELTGGCSLEWIGHRLKEYPASIVTKADSGRYCTSMLRDVINIHMAEMRDDGFLEAAWERCYQRTTPNECFVGHDSSGKLFSGQLTLHEMGGIFIFHAMLTAAALILGVIARCRKQRRLQQQPSHKRVSQYDETDPMSPIFSPKNKGDDDDDDDENSDGDESIRSQLSDVENEAVRFSLEKLSKRQKKHMQAMDERMSTLIDMLTEQASAAPGPVDGSRKQHKKDERSASGGGTNFSKEV